MSEQLEQLLKQTPDMPEVFGHCLPHENAQAFSANEMDIRILAHWGDGLYEVLLRELVLLQPVHRKLGAHHRECARLACASFQADLLTMLEPDLSPEETALIKRARNAPLTLGKRSDQALHRRATAFEALVGYWSLQQVERLELLKRRLWQLAHVDAKALARALKTASPEISLSEAPARPHSLRSLKASNNLFE